jgi:hypothetical protein
VAIDSQLLTFMPHTVTIESFTAKNNYGEDTWGASRTAAAYVEPRKVLADSTTIDQETRPLTAYISDTSITLRDRITLPDGSKPQIASVETHIEVLGLEHCVVTFQ